MRVTENGGTIDVLKYHGCLVSEWSENRNWKKLSQLADTLLGTLFFDVTEFFGYDEVHVVVFRMTDAELRSNYEDVFVLNILCVRLRSNSDVLLDETKFKENKKVNKIIVT